MPDFDCEFLIKHSATLASVLVANKMPSLTSVIKNENWYKVLVHGIPFRDFDTPTGMQLILDEIKTFNSGLTPIGTPYWATSREKRLSGLQLAGSVVVAFPNENQANRAIKNKLYIAGISARAIKFHNISSTAQCINYASFSHLDFLCKKDPRCILCGENHVTSQHYCSTCKVKGKKCSHLTPKCVNCKEAHTADSKLCERYIALKNASVNLKQAIII